MLTLTFEILFIPLVLIVAQRAYVNPRIAGTGTKSKGVVIFGAILFLFGVLGCYLAVSNALHAGRLDCLSCRFVISASRSQHPVLFWSEIILMYGFFVLFSGIGLACVYLYLVSRPNPWKKTHGNTWLYRGDASLAGRASVNVIAPALIINALETRGAALTAYQLQVFLWESHQ